MASRSATTYTRADFSASSAIFATATSRLAGVARTTTRSSSGEPSGRTIRTLRRCGPGRCGESHTVGNPGETLVAADGPGDTVLAHRRAAADTSSRGVDDEHESGSDVSVMLIRDRALATRWRDGWLSLP